MDLALVAYAAPLALAGGALMYLSARAVFQARRAATWPTAPAVVLTSSVETIGLYRTFPTSGVSRTTGVTYAYELDGVRHEGSRLRYGIWRFGGSSPEEIEMDRIRFGPGQEIMIYVNSDDSTESVADPTYDSVAVLTCVLLGLLFLASAGWLLMASVGWVTL